MLHLKSNWTTKKRVKVNQNFCIFIFHLISFFMQSHFIELPPFFNNFIIYFSIKFAIIAVFNISLSFSLASFIYVCLSVSLTFIQ